MTVTKAVEVPDEEFWLRVKKKALDKNMGVSELVIEALQKELKEKA